VVVPCRNEASWIGPCLESIVRNDYPKDGLEVLVVDGMSTDASRSVIESYADSHSFIRRLENPKKITPAALNTGIVAARGAVIMRMDAHVEYPTNYISTLVRRLDESGADNVGGVCRTCAADDRSLSRAIALGMSHPLGVGNSYFRIGTAEPRWTDTVPFGCYRREVFDRIGLFDEELIRNQDDEFNFRLIRQGGRILLLPEVVCHYYARDTLGKLWRMYFQYGYFKPLVVRKVGRVMTVRQLIPSLFVLSLAAAGLAAPWSRLAAAILLAMVLIYAGTIAACAASLIVKGGLRCSLWLCLVFPVLHVSYGLGYLKGLLDFMVLRRHLSQHLQTTPISR